MNPSRSWLSRKGSRKVRKIRMAMKKMTMKGILWAMSLLAAVLSPAFGQDNGELNKEELVDQRFFELLEMEGMVGAGAYVDSLLQVEPDNAEYLFLKRIVVGEDMEQVGYYLQKSLAADSLHPDALFDAAVYEVYVNGDYPEAFRYMDRYIRHYPDEYLGYLRRAQWNYALGKEQECIADIVSCAKVLSGERHRDLWEKAETLNDLIFTDEKDFTEQVYDAMRALLDSGYDSPFVYNLAGALARHLISDPQWAMDIINLKPLLDMLKTQEEKYGETYFNTQNQIDLYQHLGFYPGVMHCLDRILEKAEKLETDFFFKPFLSADGSSMTTRETYSILSSSMAVTYQDRAIAHFCSGQMDETASDLMSALDACELLYDLGYPIEIDGEIMLEFGKVLGYLGWGDNDVKSIYESASNLDSTLAAAYYYIGMQYKKMDSLEKAVEYFRRCIEVSNEGEYVSETYFSCWEAAMIEDDKDLQRTFKERIEESIGESDQYLTASCCYYIGEKEKAIDCLSGAFDHSFRFLGWLEYDPFWDGLREEAGFKSLLAELKARRTELLRQLGLQAE